MRDHVVLFINGEKHEVRGAAAFSMLADFLRYERRLTGTKVVCAEGDCGACTVLRGHPLLGRNPDSGTLRFDPINACIATVAQLDGAHILTIEAVSNGDALHEVQRAVVDHHGSQCGFCTPGIVMALLGHTEHHLGEAPDRKALQNHLTGNLCRCTGYDPILDACANLRPSETTSVVARYDRPELVAAQQALAREPFHVVDGDRHYVAPTTVAGVLDARAARPRARLVAGNTDLGVLMNKALLSTFGHAPAQPFTEFISLQHVAELGGVTVLPGVALHVGARATFAEVEIACDTHLPELASLLRVFASPQIKNIATLAGNIANGSPIGDSLPALLALDASLHIARPGAADRVVPLAAFYKGYKQFDLQPGELIRTIVIPLPRPGALFRADKVCQRKDLDISYVSGAWRLDVGSDGRIADARVAYGGVGPTAMRLPKAEAALVGLKPEGRAIASVAALIEAEVTPRSDVRGTEAGRRKLSGNLFRRFASGLRAPAALAGAEVTP
jgi:xanthine dehydrogenase small subunit